MRLAALCDGHAGHDASAPTSIPDWLAGSYAGPTRWEVPLSFDDTAHAAAWRSQKELVRALSRAVRALNRLVEDPTIGPRASAARERIWVSGGQLE